MNFFSDDSDEVREAVEHVLEIERLKARVKSAYMHGFDDGMDPHINWTDRHDKFREWNDS